MTLRIAHISDTHLGYRALFRSTAEGRNQRAVDIERAYQTVVDDVLSPGRNIDLVVHSGDVFHHSRPTYPAIRTFIQQTRRLCAAGIPVVVIAGNHDTPRLRTSGTVFDIVSLALMDGTFVTGHDLGTIDIPGLNVTVTAVPHGRLTDGETPELTTRSGAINILTTHGLVTGLDVPGTFHEPGEQHLNDVMFDGAFDYIALGHIHQHYRPRGVMWYSGATERIGWNDREIRPGYSLVELDRGATPLVTPIPIETARQMLQLGAIEGDGKSAREVADAILHSASNQARNSAMIRVELRGVDRSIRREVESIIRREHAAVVWSLQVTAPASDAISAFGAADGVSVETALASLPNLFDEFVTSRPYSDDFRDRFRARGLRAIDEARAALNESAGASE